MNFATVKMDSEMKEVESASSSSTSARINVDMASTSSIDVKKKKFMNLQTQHGNAMTADEENIVVFGRTFSPIRESSDEVVWHEEIEIESLEDVSTRTFYTHHYTFS